MAAWPPGAKSRPRPRHARHPAHRPRRRQACRCCAPTRTATSSPAERLPQVIDGIGADGIPNTADDIVVSKERRPPSGLASYGCTGAIRTGHAFLADIAHNAVPTARGRRHHHRAGQSRQRRAEYDNELLDAHFVAGDGRANENIGLTAVHHVFHAEHNRLVEHTKATCAGEPGDLAFINEWLVDDVISRSADGSPDGMPTRSSGTASACSRPRSSAPRCSISTSCSRSSPARSSRTSTCSSCPTASTRRSIRTIVAEFAHVVYRFGHSMLTESIDRFDPTFNAEPHRADRGLPQSDRRSTTMAAHAVDDDIAAGAIIRGMTRQVGNEIDEFVTSALRNNLLGLPLDLATINLARGRDTGVPSLNEARAQFYEATNQDALLKPYESWIDFAGHLKHEASIINFIAAYGTHSLITGQRRRSRASAMRAMTLIIRPAFGWAVRCRRIASTSSMPPAPMPAARSAASTMSISGSAALPKRSCPSAACSAPPSTSSSKSRWRSCRAATASTTCSVSTACICSARWRTTPSPP